MKRIFIILKEDILHYPPVLTILNVLPQLGVKPVHIGVYTDEEGRRRLQKKGVEFLPTISYDGKSNVFTKLQQQLKFKKQVVNYLKNAELTPEDRVWIMQAETIILLSDVVGKYNTIVHFFEYVEPVINWKYKLLNPSYDPSETLRKAKKVVCCEYNRAQITKGLFQLDELPVILPNKVEVDENATDVIPDDLKAMISSVQEKTMGKKVVLYQGIFLDAERRLEEFCEAISKMPEEYVFIAMGKGSQMYEDLKKKYESDRMIFIPFIRPPYHLLITRLASIGVLSYFPRRGPVAYTINPIYCAPNKIFEYAKYGVPMISNDIPALKYTYMEYGCGECIPYPMTTEAIADTINKVFADYERYSNGAKAYFDSVDVVKIIKDIIE